MRQQVYLLSAVGHFNKNYLKKKIKEKKQTKQDTEGLIYTSYFVGVTETHVM